MTALLSVSALTVRGGRVLVDDVSFDVPAGARVGLIGESGSGKSLTALAVTGLLPPGLVASGSAVLDPAASGSPAIDMITASERQRIRARGGIAAVVFQEPLTALDPLMRVGRQLAEPLRRWQKPRGKALEAAVCAALEEVRLPATAASSFPHQLSGGQRQRVAIAMALACRPRLLIADEPTTALDVTVQAEILDLLDTLVRERGMALLFITHDLPVAARIADHLLVLRDGRVVESGPAASVITSPSHDYTRTLVESARRFDAALDLTARPGDDPATIAPIASRSRAGQGLGPASSGEPAPASSGSAEEGAASARTGGDAQKIAPAPDDDAGQDNAPGGSVRTEDDGASHD
ncbi:ATP-binding cassette domain-containing protein [Catenuloplanes japonicus]|uniref:ATP-binding cassette domain-containing protein n=1 Tax=Catenuloplanes japonicus TaxID=33876 RepID=UPI0007C555C0|nr:ABC transporter ATP-binding protein [Catenuloplanes japonicus]